MNTAVSPAAAPARPAAKPRPARPLPWLEPAVITGAALPAAVIIALVLTGRFGANPIAEALNRFGLLAFALLILSLACTPLKLIFGVTWPIRIRKSLGLAGFFYAVLHFLTYVAVDQGLDLKTIFKDITERPFIFVGFAALLTLLPLAITSTPGMLKRMGFARWKRLHRLAYLAAGLGAVHFILRVKKDVTEPVIYAVVLGALLLIRLLPERKR